MARAYVSGDLEPHGVHPGDPYELLRALADKLDFKRPPARVLANIVRSIGFEHLKPIAPPPQEALPRWRRIAEGLRHSKTRDAEAIHHHYDVSNTFYEWVLGPSMTYTCACYPHADATLEEAQENKYRLVFEKLRLQPGDRLLDVGCGWGGMVRYAARHGVKAIGVTLSQEQAAWAQKAIADEGLSDLAEVRHGDYRDIAGDRVRRGVLDRADRAHRRRTTTRRTSASSSRRCAPAHCCSTTASPGPTTGPARPRAASSTATCSPTGSSPAPGRIITEAQDVGLEVVHEENLRHHYAMTLRDWCAQPRRALGRGGRRGRAAAPPRCGACTWPGPGSASRPMSFSCTRFWRSSSTSDGGDGGLPLRPWWTP